MILLVDTTTNPTCIGLYGGKKLKTKIIESNSENNRKLVSNIQKFINSQGSTLKNSPRLNLSAVGVINGPGTFTGVRTGVTIANTIAYALKIPIYAIDTLKAQVPENVNGVVSLLSASNTEIYFARFNQGKMEGKIEIINVENNLKNRLNKGGLIVGDLKCEHAQSLTIYQYNNITSEQRIKNLLNLILEEHIKPAKQVLPLYIKKPNITKKKI